MVVSTEVSSTPSLAKACSSNSAASVRTISWPVHLGLQVLLGLGLQTTRRTNLTHNCSQFLRRLNRIGPTPLYCIWLQLHSAWHQAEFYVSPENTGNVMKSGINTENMRIDACIFRENH